MSNNPKRDAKEEEEDVDDEDDDDEEFEGTHQDYCLTFNLSRQIKWYHKRIYLWNLIFVVTV